VFANLEIRLNAQHLIHNFNLENISSAHVFSKKKNEANFESSEEFLYELKSECECRKNQNVYVVRDKRRIISIYNNAASIRAKKPAIKMNQTEFMRRSFTCDPYNVLRRGSNQKVIGFSLYGKKRFYYNKIKDIVKQAKQFYPDWFVRIHYDSTIDKSIICEVECLKNEANTSFVDNTDFCNIDRVFLGFRDFASNNSINANYIHKMMWRWFVSDRILFFR
jgi:hypothetical protein